MYKKFSRWGEKAREVFRMQFGIDVQSKSE